MTRGSYIFSKEGEVGSSGPTRPNLDFCRSRDNATRFLTANVFQQKRFPGSVDDFKFLQVHFAKLRLAEIDVAFTLKIR